MLPEIHEEDVIHNLKRDFGEADRYHAAVFNPVDSGRGEPLLFTDDQIDTARTRALNNPHIVEVAQRHERAQLRATYSGIAVAAAAWGVLFFALGRYL